MECKKIIKFTFFQNFFYSQNNNNQAKKIDSSEKEKEEFTKVVIEMSQIKKNQYDYSQKQLDVWNNVLINKRKNQNKEKKVFKKEKIESNN